jgi:hypothetical protein
VRTTGPRSRSVVASRVSVEPYVRLHDREQRRIVELEITTVIAEIPRDVQDEDATFAYEEGAGRTYAWGPLCVPRRIAEYLEEVSRTIDASPSASTPPDRFSRDE